MEHVVFFPAVDGTPAFRRVSSLDEAVRLVEHLRNREGVVEASVHALTDVPLSFRAYYHVEVPGSGAEAPAADPVTDEAAAASVQDDAVADAVAVAVAQELLEDAPAAELPQPAAVEEQLDEPTAGDEPTAQGDEVEAAEDAPEAGDAAHDPRHLEAVASTGQAFAPPVGPAVSAPLLELVPSQATSSEQVVGTAQGAAAAASVSALPVGVPFGEPARSLGFFS